eukprot:PhF_6_TR7060/c0_g1_i2/m.10659
MDRSVMLRVCRLSMLNFFRRMALSPVVTRRNSPTHGLDHATFWKRDSCQTYSYTRLNPTILIKESWGIAICCAAWLVSLKILNTSYLCFSDAAIQPSDYIDATS